MGADSPQLFFPSAWRHRILFSEMAVILVKRALLSRG